VPTHKFLPGRAIALEALLDQLGILLQASLSPIFPIPALTKTAGDLTRPAI